MSIYAVNHHLFPGLRKTLAGGDVKCCVAEMLVVRALWVGEAKDK